MFVHGLMFPVLDRSLCRGRFPLINCCIDPRSGPDRGPDPTEWSPTPPIGARPGVNSEFIPPIAARPGNSNIFYEILRLGPDRKPQPEEPWKYSEIPLLCWHSQDSTQILYTQCTTPIFSALFKFVHLSLADVYAPCLHTCCTPYTMHTRPHSDTICKLFS